MCIYAAVKIAMTSCCHSNNDIIVLLTLDELDDSVVQCSHGNQSVQKIIRNDTHSRRSSIAAVHCRRPCLSRGRGASVEQSAGFRHGVNVAAHVQATPEDCTVREKLLNTGCFRRLEHLPSHVYLFAFNFVRYPCSCSDIMPP